MARMRALVVGAGAGGLTAAVALRRAGIDVTVFERAPAPLRVGAGVHIWTNALLALGHLGLGDRAAEAGSRLERSLFLTRTGRALVDWPTGEWGRDLGAPTVGIKRPELNDLLLRAIEDDLLRFGMLCTGFSQDADGVEARFEGGHIERGDALVGADGLESTIRAQLLGPEPPRYAGYTGRRAVLAWPDEDTGVLRVFEGPGCRFVTYPVAPGERYFLSTVRSPPGGHDEPGQSRAILREQYADFVDPVPAIIDATPEQSIMRTDIVDRDPVRRWGEGRVTLLGDAAHPMTPDLAMGACMAIEDGVVLAESLRGADNDVAAALRSYERDRMRRTARLTNQSRTLGRMSHWSNPVACTVRDAVQTAVMRTVARWQMKRDISFSL